MVNLQSIWVDLTVAVKEAEPPATFRRWCETKYPPDIARLEEFIDQQVNSIDLICFNFDYPDRRGLRLLRNIKSLYPSLPLVMLTVQHSEALAIWAFRTKVWDYLVKPVANRDAERCLISLSRALKRRNKQAPRDLTMAVENIPDEVAILPLSDDQSLAPAIYYIERNFSATVRSEDLAARCNLSPFRFSRLFKEKFGLTFRDYLINYRLREAYRLLENPRVSVADVSFAVGFNDPSYFARVFKQRIGIAPSRLVGHRNDSSADGLLDLFPSVSI